MELCLSSDLLNVRVLKKFNKVGVGRNHGDGTIYLF